MILLRPILMLAILAPAVLCSCAGSHSTDRNAEETAIVGVMKAAEQAWNAGDLEAYMACYWKDEAVRFAGKDRVTLGWRKVLDGYRKAYADSTAMGKLTFSDLDVDVVADDAAVVFGRWRLSGLPDDPHGLFTLLFRRIEGRWVIVHDHTSSAAPPIATGVD